MPDPRSLTAPTHSAARRIVVSAVILAFVGAFAFSSFSLTHPAPAHATAPTAIIFGASGVGYTTADVEGLIEPEGLSTTWRFQYATEADFSDAVDAPSGVTTEPEVVVGHLTSIAPSTTYYVRLLAENADGTGESAAESFQTLEPTAPEVVATFASAVTTDGAVIDAEINSGGASTTFQFEYVTQASFDIEGFANATTTPEEPLLGPDNVPATASASLTGLLPDTIYRFRVNADNANGSDQGSEQYFKTFAPESGQPDGCPNRTIRAEQHSQYLPRCRAFELVSPPVKNGSDVIASGTLTRAAADGSAATFASLGGFGDVAGTGIAAEYLSRRTGVDGTRGWTTHSLFPKLDPLSFSAATQGMDTFYMGEMSADLSRGVLHTFTNLSGDPTLAPVANLYRRDDLLSPGSGSFETVSQCPACTEPLTYNGSTPNFVDATSDFGRIVFESSYPLVSGVTPGEPNVYEWDHGVLRLVGVLPQAEGGGPAGESIAGAGSTNYTLNLISDESDDHSRVFFAVPSTGRLYMRIDHATTVRLDASERAVPGAERPATYQTASQDGTKIYFTTSADLTEDSTANNTAALYMYDASLPDDSPGNLTYVLEDENPGDGLAARVTGLLGASDDGSHIYFLSRNRLVPDQPIYPGASYIYSQSEAGTEYVGALTDVGDVGLNRLGVNFGTGALGSRVSPDGEHLLFTAHSGEGLTGYDHGNSCGINGGSPCSEVYLYSAGTHKLACVSCSSANIRAGSDASFSLTGGRGGSRLTTHLVDPMSADGSQVFFTTADPLVPDDHNGQRDVYEYDAGIEAQHLISTGSDPGDSNFMDASVNGDDLFFTTRERLSGWDTDNAVDLYDARASGGMPEPVSAGVDCRGGDSCQGVPSTPPLPPTNASASFSGSPNPPPKRRHGHRHRRKKQGQHGRHRHGAHGGQR